MAAETGTPPSSRSWSLVDLVSVVAVVFAAAGVIWSPKLNGAITRATGNVVPVMVTVDVRGIPVANPAALVEAARKEGKVAIVIRNQPHGSVQIKNVGILQRKLVAVQPDGYVVTATDPNQATFGTLDARFLLAGQGLKSEGGVVFGNQNIKIGTPIELEGNSFRVSGSVTGLQVGR